VILVGQYDSPFVRRVAAALNVVGLDYVHSPLSVFGDADAMRRINPLGRVPALMLGEDPETSEVLVDSGAILDWLDEAVGPDRALLPPGGAERRRQLQLVALATGCIDKLGAVAYERRLRPPERRWTGWIERCTVQARSGLASLESRIAASRGAPQPWLGGQRIGQADITVGCLMGYLELADPELRTTLDGTALDRLARACEALPAFVATKPAAYVLPPPG
jgi:glutathione S-transferase